MATVENAYLATGVAHHVHDLLHLLRHGQICALELITAKHVYITLLHSSSNTAQSCAYVEIELHRPQLARPIKFVVNRSRLLIYTDFIL